MFTTSPTNHSANITGNSRHLDSRSSTQWYWTLRGLVGLLIVTGNALIIYIIASRRRLHSTTNWLTISLAVADFLVGVAVVPSSYFCAFKIIKKCNFNIVSILNLLFFFVSVGNLCALTIDRFTAVMIPYKYYILKTKKWRLRMIAMAWLIPAVLCLMPLTWQQHKSVTFKAAITRIYDTIEIACFTLLPCSMMLVAYGLIYHATWKQSRTVCAHSQHDQVWQRQRQQSRRLRRDGQASIRVYGLIVVLFVACWSLSAYRYFKEIFTLGQVPRVVVYISRLLMLTNSAVNPIVYAIFKKDIRAELRARIRNLTGWEISSTEPPSVSIHVPSQPAVANDRRAMCTPL